MTKPHEETWEVDGDWDVRRVNSKGERTSLVWLKAASGSLEANVLGSTAPDMARELLDAVQSFRRGYRITEAQIRGMEKALKKAGVLT